MTVSLSYFISIQKIISHKINLLPLSSFFIKVDRHFYYKMDSPVNMSWMVNKLDYSPRTLAKMENILSQASKSANKQLVNLDSLVNNFADSSACTEEMHNAMDLSANNSASLVNISLRMESSLGNCEKVFPSLKVSLDTKKNASKYLGE